MSERDDCIAEILKAIKDRKDRKYVQDRLEEVDARAEAAEDGSPRERYFRAAREMLAEQAEQSAQMRRVVHLQALTLRDLRTAMAAGVAATGSHALAIEAPMVGINPAFFDPKSGRGNQLSAAAISRGAQKSWIGGAELDMIRAGREDPKYAGLVHDFLDPRGSFNWFREKIELEHKAKGLSANPGRTGDARALKIAEILQRWDREKISAQNGAGAWISEHSAFGAPVSHDPNKMMAAAGNLARRMWASVSKSRPEQSRLWEEARQAWTAKTLARIDARAMFGTAEDADKKLAEMFGGLATGDHGEMVTVGEDPIMRNLAQSVSVHRAFVWKSADAQLAHMLEFGRFNPTDAWLYAMRRGADAYGLMKVFGPKPKENVEELIAYAKNLTMGKPERREIDKAAPDLAAGGGGWLRNRYAVISGEADRPIENVWSGVVTGVMAVQRWSKLGLTPFAMLQDNATISRELAYQGVAFFERNSGLASGYFQGAEGSGKRELAELLHAGLRAQNRGVTARLDVSDAKSGTIAAVDNLFFGWTGIRAMTENKRAWSQEMMAWHFGRQREKAWGELERPESRIMEAFGIGEREWELLRKAEWNAIEGETYLTPDVALKIPDADVEAYRSAGKSISARADPTQSAGDLNAVRKDLGMKLWSYFSERGDFAVIEVGAREKAMLYQGTQSGSTLNNALRLLLQFKQFPTAMISKVWGRELNGGDKGMNRIAGLVELIVSSTLYGMAANYLNQIVKGQDPNSQWRNQPAGAVIAGFLRGGGASIYGDFLVGEWSRHGQQALETLAGPTVGQVNQVFEIWADLTHMKKGAATAALAARSLRGNLPFANMIYTKAAVDYLVYYRFMEWLNPGYLERMERTMKDKSGTEFWLRPTRTNQIGVLPAISEAIGGKR